MTEDADGGDEPDGGDGAEPDDGVEPTHGGAEDGGPSPFVSGLRMLVGPRFVVGAVGTVALLVAAVTIHAPLWSPVPLSVANDVAETLGPTGLVYGLWLAVVWYSLLAVLVTRSRTAGVEPLVESPPELPRADRTAVLAAEFDAAFESGARPELLRSRLRAAAVETWMRTAGVDRERARAVVDRGEWTDDPRAAAFLGEDVDQPPVPTRVRDLLANEPGARRYARHAVAAIEDAWARSAPEVEADG